MATNIPPYLTEVINGSLALLENPKTSIDQLTQSISGLIFRQEELLMERWASMRPITLAGVIYVRAKTSVEEDKSGNQSLVINEIPYMVNKARMLEKIAELVKDKKIDGIREIRDESDKDGLKL